MSLSVDGKFFLRDGMYHFLKVVTYGPFPEGSPHRPDVDFPRIAEAGFNAVRIYSLPDQEMLDLAVVSRLHLIPTLPWAHGCDFIADESILENARERLTSWLADHREHEGLGALLIGNEIPTDMARWMGADKVCRALDSLILSAKKISPNLPVAYASFPTTEYLEPQHADFTAFNLYLENAEKLNEYLPRLHHVAGDRPVLLAEFGLDTGRNSEELQAELFEKALRSTHLAGFAGFTAYAWSDHWFNNGETVVDWSFGLVRRDCSEKPALAALTTEMGKIKAPPLPEVVPKVSLIICTRNGAQRLESCLTAAKAIDYPDLEILVVNDGSTDETAELLEGTECILCHHIEPSGLSFARNYGASKATGEILAFTDDDCQPDRHWISWLAYTYATTDHVAIGGPNLPPPPQSAKIAVSGAAMGAPTHVMSDTTAEHLPGCNVSVRRSAFEEIKGFDPVFETAGDDVDFCWRLRDLGHTLGFCGAAFVWHDRRPTPWRYLKQQIGYGHAEALLFHKHPDRFAPGGRGGIRWEGCVYTGGPRGIQHGDLIYTGPAGEASYQSLVTRTQPVRPLPVEFDSRSNRMMLRVLNYLQGRLRPWARERHGGPPPAKNHARIHDEELPANQMYLM